MTGRLEPASASVAQDLYEPPMQAVRQAVGRALEEDLLPLGDLSALLIPAGSRARFALVARQPGVVAGRLCAVETFVQTDSSISVAWELPDGSDVSAGDEIARVEGPLASILTAERTALNFLCHLSGVALPNPQIRGRHEGGEPGDRVLDTRKTTPGLRALEKAAVRSGGGFNHRGSLSEAVIVKDNHLAGSISDAVRRRAGCGRGGWSRSSASAPNR